VSDREKRNCAILLASTGWFSIFWKQQPHGRFAASALSLLCRYRNIRGKQSLFSGPPEVISKVLVQAGGICTVSSPVR
jgi:hypothetical protein